MLKPRYGNVSESVSDFNRMLDGMNKTQPLERTFADDLSEMFNVEQQLVQLEQQIEHVTKVITDSSVQVSEEDANNISKMHTHAANMYGQAANKAKHRIEAAQRVGNRTMMAKMQEVHDRLRQMSNDHAQKAKTRIENKIISESVQSRTSDAMRKMRVLAGIDGTGPLMPRDPGVFGTTRFNEGYDSMMTPFAVRPSAKGAHDHVVVKEKDPGEAVRLKKSIDFVSGRKTRNEARDKDVEEGRSKDQQIKGQEAMMKRSFPKRHAQWSADRDAIIAGSGKIDDGERAVPRFLNQRAGKAKDTPENDKK